MVDVAMNITTACVYIAPSKGGFVINMEGNEQKKESKSSIQSRPLVDIQYFFSFFAFAKWLLLLTLLPPPPPASAPATTLETSQ